MHPLPCCICFTHFGTSIPISYLFHLLCKCLCMCKMHNLLTDAWVLPSLCWICAHTMQVHEWKKWLPTKISSIYLVGHESTKMVKDRSCKLFELSAPILKGHKNTASLHRAWLYQLYDTYLASAVIKGHSLNIHITTWRMYICLYTLWLYPIYNRKSCFSDNEE